MNFHFIKLDFFKVLYLLLQFQRFIASGNLVFRITSECQNVLSRVRLDRYRSSHQTTYLSTLVALIVCLGGMMPQSAIGQTNRKLAFSFTLGTEATTSAGVFTNDGTLVRTLWSGIKYSAGTHASDWDGIDNEGQLSADGSYNVKVVSNNVKYEWEGVIGNTSEQFSGSTVHHASQVITNMVTAGSQAYIAVGYNEGAASYLKFPINNPQTRFKLHDKDGHTVRFVASDGNYVYWAGQKDETTTFIAATKVADDTDIIFSKGEVVTTNHRTYNGIDVTASSLITGMAVQQKGHFLFVSHKSANYIKVFNKVTGAQISILSIKAPRELAIDGDDNLWLIYDTNTVAKLTANSTGTLRLTDVRLVGLLEPLAIAISPITSTVALLDGSTSQQVKAFNASSGTATWTLGQMGGYATSPNVANDKFYFANTKIFIETDYGAAHPYLCFQSDGSFWVGDNGNLRSQHFSANLTYLNQVAYLGYFYSCVADPNNPKRVFANYLEFEVDYSKPLKSNNGSWRLVKNWSAGQRTDYDNSYTRLQCVTTLRNGHTYALATHKYPNRYTNHVIELPATGNLRYTGVETPSNLYQLFADGSLWNLGSNALSQPASWKKQVLTSFDNNNNPQWGVVTEVASTPPVIETDPLTHGGGLKREQITSSGVVVAFCSDKYNGTRGGGWHLGGVKVGTNKWLWKTSPSTVTNYEGEFPSKGAYDIGNRVQYTGTFAQAIERNIFWGYNGEFWKNSQTNKWNHYLDNGLFIGQFGITRAEADLLGEAAPAMAGNALTGTFVKVNDAVYLYHCDENTHAGIHRWKISGLNTIQEQTVGKLTLVATSPNGHGLLVQYFIGPNLDNANRVSSTLSNNIQSAYPAYSARWTGFVEPSYNQPYTFQIKVNKKARLWLNDKLIINQWNNDKQAQLISPSIILEAGHRYALRLEISGGTVALQWARAGLTQEIIPATSLYASDLPDTSSGINLTEGLWYNDTFENGMYGWKRSPTEEYGQNSEYGNKWLTRTNIRSLNRISPDLNIFLQPPTAGLTATVSRNLSGNGAATEKWSISGEINYPATDDYDKLEDKGFWQVLDRNNNVIARIQRRQINWPNDYRVYLNNRVVAQGSYQALQKLIAKDKYFVLSVSSNGVTLQYGELPAVTVPPLDLTSDWRHPQTFQVLFYSKTQAEHILNLSNMRFVTTTSSTSLATPLPVVLSNFSVKSERSQVRNSWSIASMVRVDSFVIERSADSYKFTPVGVVQVQRGTEEKNSYEFLDNKPLLGPSYYRLKIVDTDASFKYSSIIAVVRQATVLIIYPNPVKSHLQVQHPLGTGGQLSIFSATGKRLIMTTVKPDSTSSVFDVKELPLGMYILQYHSDSLTTTKRFFKE